MKHYERCPRRKMTDIRQQVLKANLNKEKFKLSPFNFDQEISRKELARMIIMHEYLLKIVEHDGFKSFVKSLNPCFKIVTRNTIKNDCLKMYEQLKELTMSIFEKNESRVVVTTDMWTFSYQKKGFMAVTTHYIDNNWKLQSQIIRFIYVPSPHTSEVLCEALVECLLDWNIDKKLSTITVDNCSTNDAMIELLLEKLSLDSFLLGGKLVHMRCCAHILNLIVKDGLKVIGDAIEKVRDSVSYWSGTPKRWEKFEETTRQLHIPLVLDPRYKLVLLEYYFPKIYSHESEYEVEKILVLCRELLKQYENIEKMKGDGDVSGFMVESGATIDASLSEFDLYASTKKKKSLRSELDLYLDEDVLPRTVDFDVLSWWKANKGKYPILSQIAKDILAIPVSTVASESAFSTSGRLVSPHRSKLYHKTIEGLMCAQNWILAEIKITRMEHTCRFFMIRMMRSVWLRIEV